MKLPDYLPNGNNCEELGSNPESVRYLFGKYILKLIYNELLCSQEEPGYKMLHGALFQYSIMELQDPVFTHYSTATT